MTIRICTLSICIPVYNTYMIIILRYIQLLFLSNLVFHLRIFSREATFSERFLLTYVRSTTANEFVQQLMVSLKVDGATFCNDFEMRNYYKKDPETFLKFKLYTGVQKKYRPFKFK